MSKENKEIEEAKHSIAAAADDAVKTIATAADEAAKVVASATAQAAKLAETKSAGDHDLLVVLNTKMEGLKCDIQELKSGTSQRITDLETEKANKETLTPIKEKIDTLETRIWYVVAGITLSLIGAIISYMVRK